jgi:hypothetical protein
MFNKRTLFVVGAGASKEVGLPTGTELMVRIATKLDLRFNANDPKLRSTGDVNIRNSLREQADRSGVPLNDYLRSSVPCPSCSITQTASAPSLAVPILVGHINMVLK